MKSLIPRSSLHRATASALNSASANGASDPPPVVVAWLARLSLLYGVPFTYLVPDYRMLPPESIRWGFLDPNWTARAADGAMNVGRTTTAAVAVDVALSQSVRRALPAAIPLVRASLRGDAAPTELSSGGTVTVMLIRSAVVAGYPGLEIRGLDSQGDDVQLLRFDQLSKDVMIALFAELPATVELLEPPEGLHFGVRWNSTHTSMTTLLRSLQTATLGQQVLDGSGTPVAVDLPARSNSGANVLDIVGSMNSIVAGLQTYNHYTGSTLAPADMAIEMVRAAGLQRFVPGTPPSQDEDAQS